MAIYCCLSHCETEDKRPPNWRVRAPSGSCRSKETSKVWPYHQENGFACTWCTAGFGGRCKRARKAKKNMAHRHRRVDGDWGYNMSERGWQSAGVEGRRKIIKSSKCPNGWQRLWLWPCPTLMFARNRPAVQPLRSPAAAGNPWVGATPEVFALVRPLYTLSASASTSENHPRTACPRIHLENIQQNLQSVL